MQNSNILVSEIGQGERIFELTRENEIVWEWFNPSIDSASGQPEAIYRAEHIPMEVVDIYREQF